MPKLLLKSMKTASQLSVRNMVHVGLNMIINQHFRHVRAAERSRLCLWPQEASNGHGIRYDDLEGKLAMTIMGLGCNMDSSEQLKFLTSWNPRYRSGRHRRLD